MILDSKKTVHSSVQAYLQDKSPDKLEEFEIVFDDVYETIKRRMSEKTGQGGESQKEGLAFDPGLVVGTTISVACWISATLVKAVIKDWTIHNLPTILDKIEPELAAWTGKEELVHFLRLRIERIIKNH